MFDMRWNEESGTFDTFGGFENFHSAFGYMSELVEITSEESFTDEGRKVNDPATRAYLPRYDLETGASLYGETPMVFRTPPLTNMTAAELEAVFMGRDPEQRANFYNNQNALIEVIEDALSVDNMTNLHTLMFERQFADGEIDRDVINERGVEQEVQEPEDAPPDERDPDEVPAVDWQWGGGDLDDDDDDDEPNIMQQLQLMDQPDEEDFPINDGEDDNNRQGGNYFISTINSLVKLSQELEDEGKTLDSIEILKVAKKFSNILKKG